MRVEPDPREGGGHVVNDEISRDEDASKVARPRFRMGLKPTALLRHAAKVRLALPLAQNDTGRDVAKCFSFFPPLSHGKPCQLSHKESLRSRSPCYSRWQRGKLCKDRAEEVTARKPSPAGEGVAHSVTDEACCKAVEEVETRLRKPKGLLLNLFILPCGTPHPPQAVPLPPGGRPKVPKVWLRLSHFFLLAVAHAV